MQQYLLSLVCSQWNIARKLTSHSLYWLRQTFDKVPYVILLHKLNSDGLFSYCATWFHGQFMEPCFMILYKEASVWFTHHSFVHPCVVAITDSRKLKGIGWLAPVCCQESYLVSWEQDMFNSRNDSDTHTAWCFHNLIFPLKEKSSLKTGILSCVAIWIIMYHWYLIVQIYLFTTYEIAWIQSVHSCGPEDTAEAAVTVKQWTAAQLMAGCCQILTTTTLPWLILCTNVSWNKGKRIQQ